jgi:hypothetical protein
MQSCRWIECVATALVSIAMSGAVSAVMALANQGFDGFIPSSWLMGGSLGFIVSFPTAFIVVPLVQRWAAGALIRANSPDTGTP